MRLKPIGKSRGELGRVENSASAIRIA